MRRWSQAISAGLEKLAPAPVTKPSPAGRLEILGLATVLLAGFVFRLLYIEAFRAQDFPPDVPWSIALNMISPYDTVPREPLFVWWLRGLHLGGARDYLTLRTWTVLWYLPTGFFLWRGGQRFLGSWVWLALILHASLPIQIAADANGERHVIETFLVVAFWARIYTVPPPVTPRALAAIAPLMTGLFLIRLNLGISAAAGWLSRLRRRREIWVFAIAFGVACTAVIPHLLANHRKTGDPFYSINLHAYWFANKEFIGRPGYAATPEEWERDPYRRSLTYREWAFGAHGFTDYMKETLSGFGRIIKTEIGGYLLAFKVPAPLRWWALTFLGLGLLGGLMSPMPRATVGYLALLLLPFAFVSHVHMAPRFFAPTYPLIGVFIALGHRWVFQRAQRIPVSLNPIRRSLPRGGPPDG